ncbi:MAG: amidoligase family protein [Verrucomicrobiota bacterium]
MIGKIGVEIELLAPKGRSREDLANAVAKEFGGDVQRYFHPQGEPSKVRDTPYFENLTLGFVVFDDDGNIHAHCVDDLTLQTDLDRKHPPQPGWYRIVSDDARLLRLVMAHTDAEEPLDTVLLPIADLFGTQIEKKGGMFRVSDETSAPIAIGAPLPGERERPCELITPPIDSDHQARLEALLGLAKALDFTVPTEGATHLHFDGASLCNAATVANLVRFLHTHSDELKKMMGTNPHCRRLGGWPAELIEMVEKEDFAELPWDQACERLGELQLTKYCDFNLANLVRGDFNKRTFEVRILPVSMDAGDVIETAEFFAGILDWARDCGGKLKPIPASVKRKTPLRNSV